MPHPLLDVDRIVQAPEAYLASAGCVFAVFDHRTQDSGNVAYGVRIGDACYFVKTAGHPDDPLPRPGSPRHSDRVALLENAVRLSRNCPHPALPHLHRVIESPDGPMLVYDWADGELIRVDAQARNDPASSFQRFRALPVAEILRTLDTVYDLHSELAQAGWIAVDFYDGCLIYDFARRNLSVVDLDHYSASPFTNRVGRMFGSSRFMAPEEFELGARIDGQTTVFTLGRTAVVLLSDGTLTRGPFRGSDALYDAIHRACREDRSQRFESVAAFYAAWRNARSDG